MSFDPGSARRFDLVDLRLFVHVTETGSITAGARRAHLALAAASARIRGMEETLGAPLLERQRQGVRLTPAGRAVAHHARRVLDQLEHMRGDLEEYATGLRGHVRLLSNTAALAEFLPDALGTFLAEHPQVDVDVEERPSHEIVRAMARGRADVGVVADAVDLGALETFPFRGDRLVVVTPQRHPLAARASVAFAEVLGEDFVGLTSGSALHDYIVRQAEAAGRALRFRVRLRGFDAICRLVERGVGIAVLPEAAAARGRRTAAVAVVPLADAWSARQLTLCVQRLDALPSHARQLVEALRAAPAAAPTARPPRPSRTPAAACTPPPRRSPRAGRRRGRGPPR